MSSLPVLIFISSTVLALSCRILLGDPTFATSTSVMGLHVPIVAVPTSLNSANSVNWIYSKASFGMLASSNSGDLCRVVLHWPFSFFLSLTLDTMFWPFHNCQLISFRERKNFYLFNDARGEKLALGMPFAVAKNLGLACLLFQNQLGLIPHCHCLGSVVNAFFAVLLHTFRSHSIRGY